jgi:hypothetical protein
VAEANQWTLTERIVDTEVETTVNDDTNDRGDEASVETGETVRLEGLTVDVDETVELTVPSALCRLGVVSESCTSVIQRVHKEQRGSTSSTTRGDVASEPRPVTIRLLETEQGLEVILWIEQRMLRRYSSEEQKYNSLNAKFKACVGK